MITKDVLEKEKYISPTKGDLTDASSFLNSKSLENYILESDEFKRSLVRNQWKYVKRNLKNNTNIRTILQVGSWYDLKDNYKIAIDYYLQALSLDYENISIYKKIINTLVKHKKFDEAEKYFTKLFEITSDNKVFKDYIFFKMVSSDKYFDVDSIINLINQSLKNNTNDIDLISLKGFLLLNFKNDINLSEQIFKDCLAINKNYIHALNNLGVCYLRKDDVKNAEKYFKLGIDVSPFNYPFTYQNLALIYINKGDLKMALSVLDSALFNNISLSYEFNHMYGWLLLNNTELEKAKSWYQDLIKKEPLNNLLYNNLGVCYSKEKNISVAINYFDKAINLCKEQIKKGVLKDSRSLQAFYNRGRMAIRSKDTFKIKEISENILLLDTNNAYGYYFEGSYFLKNEEYDKAIISFEKAISIDKKIPEIYPEYSFLLSSIKKEYEKAIIFLNQAIELGYNDDSIFNNLAFSYIKSGNINEGEKIINQHKESILPPFIATKGLLEIRKNNLKKGIEYYKEAIALLSGFDKTVASKILEIEVAGYWIRKGNINLAKEHINKANAFEKTYIDQDLIDLENIISSQLTK